MSVLLARALARQRPVSAMLSLAHSRLIPLPAPSVSDTRVMQNALYSLDMATLVWTRSTLR